MLDELHAVRRREADARALLESGCREDVAALRGLLESHLRKARRAIEACPRPAKERADAIAAICVKRAFANANVRFRARFAIYAEALAAAERHVRSRGVRRIALPRILCENERSIVPEMAPEAHAADRWMAELESRLSGSLQGAIERACRAVIQRGAVRLARASIAFRLGASATRIEAARSIGSPDGTAVPNAVRTAEAPSVRDSASTLPHSHEPQVP